MKGMRALLAGCCSAAVTLAQVGATAPTANVDGVPPRERARGEALRLELRATFALRGASALALADDGCWLAVERQSISGGFAVTLVDVAREDVGEVAVPGRLAAVGHGLAFVVDGGNLLEVEPQRHRVRTVCALAAKGGMGSALGHWALFDPGTERFACEQVEPGGLGGGIRGIRLASPARGRPIAVFQGQEHRDWVLGSDGALLCTVVSSIGCCGTTPSALVHMAPDGAVHRFCAPARSCDFALDGRNVLATGDPGTALCRVPDLAVVRTSGRNGQWVRAVDPVLALSHDGRTITVWHVPTLTPLAGLPIDVPDRPVRLAAVDRHRRWLALATATTVGVFAIVRP